MMLISNLIINCSSGLLRSLILAGNGGFNNKVFRNEWCKNILPKLLDFERKSWAIIANDSSGKSRGTRNHHVSINDLDKVAQKRLKKLQLDESNSLYSLRLDGKKRIWGIVHNNVLNLLWYDPYHHVCPSKR